MRFLCLHGKGTSAKIFQSQTSTFRKLLPSTFEFDFIDGPFPDSAAAGIDLFYSPPYYKLTESFTLESLKKGHDWVLELIEKNGPYDGVMCFSQGCSVVSSLLLYNQQSQPDAAPLFKVAVFICGGTPLDALAAVGAEVTQEARDIDEASKSELHSRASSAAILRDGADRWGSGFDPSSGASEGEGEGAQPASRNVFGIDVARIPEKMKIPIPTVHVYGAKDPRFPAGVTLAHFCAPRLRKTYDHGGGHEIPRSKEVSSMLAELVEWCEMVAERW